jgi:predicted membrane GTPase involved in stress response
VRSITEPLVEGSLLVLFINKIDRMEAIDSALLSEIRQQFEALESVLSSVAGTHLKVVYGAASVGMGIAGSDVGDEGFPAPVSLYSELIRMAT